ncbi:MAG: tetratricopeptide repeat protein [Verrucomicrobia bacterium]|jgi:protein O-mannosyl-transferase|nr:tetratricopeptide repeat protein [Verrucomicrobiota bacterium]
MKDLQQTRRLLPPLLLILAGVLVYWSSFDGVFVYDDLASIRDNPHIRQLWPLSEAMSLPLWSSALTVDGRPLLSLSFALNHWLFGPEPWGYHLVNLLIHIGAGLLLFGVIRRTLALPRFRERFARSACPSEPWRSRGTWLALATALIWIVHPLQTESVTYIVQRAESLMGMLFLLTMYCSIRGFTSDKGGRWHVAAVLACAIGMGVKQTMFSVPLLVILYDYVFTGGLEPGGLALGERGLQRAAPVARARRARGRFYAALCSTWLIVFGIIGLTWKESTSDFVTISPLRYALTQPLVLLTYLRLAIWPWPLALSYGWTLEDQWPRIVFPAIAILGMLAVMFRGLWRRKWYGFVLAWFFLILAPTSSIAPMRQAIFEHRMYLSLAAVVMLAVLGAEYAVRKLATHPKRRAAVGGCLALASVIVLGYRTHDRNRDYHSAMRIWQDNVAHCPESHFARNNLACSLRNEGRYAEAVRHLRSALRIQPDHVEAHNNLGNALHALGRPLEAIPHYREALRLKPDYAEAHNNWGMALYATGRPQDAISHYQQALQLDPGRVEAHYNLGVALAAAGRLQEAIPHYQQAVQLKPDHAEAHNNLGNALLTLGHLQAAIPHCREALRIKPDMAEASFNLGNALLALGQPREAVEHYRHALQLKPDHAEAHNNLSIALRDLGMIDREMIGEGEGRVED